MASQPKTIGMRVLTKNVAVAGTAEKLSSLKILTTEFTLYVKSTNSGSNAYIGDQSVDSSWIPRAKGSITNFVSGNGRYLANHPDVPFDLSKIYVDVDTGGDGVVVQYLHGEQ